MSKNQFTGTATQPQRNRKFCQFNKDQYCTCNMDTDLTDELRYNWFVVLFFWILTFTSTGT